MMVFLFNIRNIHELVPSEITQSGCKDKNISQICKKQSSLSYS